MKNLIFILFIVIFSACVTKNPESISKMRRFTFAAFNQLADTTSFKSISADQRLQDLLHNSGVVNYNYCTLDSISYLVLDMEESFDLAQIKSLFNKLSVDQAQLKRFSEIVNGEYELLDRIYKMEQQAEFKTEEGQLIPKQKDNYARFVLTLEIINDPEMAKEYVEVHAIGKAWPEITQNMKTVGIYEMELYLMGYRAFLIMDTKPDFDWNVDGERWGTLPREKEWQAHVAKFQKTDPESKAAEKWKIMKMISFSDN